MNPELSCPHELFEYQVDRQPWARAVICQDRYYTFQEIEDRANQLAHHLRAEGVRTGNLVALLLNRSEKSIIAILGILKAGAAYIPLDPSYPEERIAYILESADVKQVVTEKIHEAIIPKAYQRRAVFLEEGGRLARSCRTDRLKREETGLTPDSVCYVLYTSGTTGRPKGVMIEHRNVTHFLASFNTVCGIHSGDRIYHGFSLSFDGSVEEIWLALAHGALLVIGTADIGRIGPEVARLIREQAVTVFSTVPTFLGMIEEDLPLVRVLILGGEACPQALVNKWDRPERLVLNVYGPTEATINSTFAVCSAHKPVTIGHPLKNYEAYILDENLRPVPQGDAGELCISGVGLARGYLNQPDLTAQKFVTNLRVHDKSVARLYRTGDLARMNADGHLEFLGRIDTQVKVRGYRIELAEIEAVLQDHDAIQLAVVNVHRKKNLDELAAYVVPRRPLAADDYRSILQLLRQRLPAFMIPAYLDVLDALPTLSSGKIDRKQLPEPKASLIAAERLMTYPQTETEIKVLRIWEQVFHMKPISATDNFFLDLGGYSLLAAETVSRLRQDHDFEVSIRDIYESPTIQQLSRRIDSQTKTVPPLPLHELKSESRTASEAVYENSGPWVRRCCQSAQALALFMMYSLAAFPFAFFIYLVMLVIEDRLALGILLGIAAAFMILAYPLYLLLIIAGKWLIIGRYKAGRYPLWGLYYFRCWLVTTLQNMSGIGAFAGTPLLSYYFRLMGARIGSQCILDTSLCVAFDLLSIGDETSIGSQSQILCSRVEDGMMILGTVEIGKRCFVGTHSAIGLNVRMGDDSHLGDQSYLEDNTVMPRRNVWRGSPARMDKARVSEFSTVRPGRYRPVLWSLLHYFASFLMILSALPFLLPVLAVGAAYLYGGWLWFLPAFFLSLPLGTLGFCLYTWVAKTILLPDARPGLYPVQSTSYLRKWLFDQLMGISTVAVRTLYKTIYLPIWLRMLGAKIGRHAEIAVPSILMPELTTIGDESFFADGSMVGGRRFFRGHVQFARSSVGRRSFLGNSALLSMGSSLGDDCLLGVLSLSPPRMKQTPTASEWLGSPSFRLPHRRKVESFTQQETYSPNRRLTIMRTIIDTMRILIPNFLVTAAFWIFVMAGVTAYQIWSFWSYLGMMSLVGMGLVLSMLLTVVVLKKVLIGRFKPEIKPLWSLYVWINELVTGAYETISAPLLAPMLGTPFFAWYLRALGCRIGKNAYIATSLFAEFDLVDIGDHVALNMGVIVQNHLFEDRIFKSSKLSIGNGCSLGNMAVILYDTEMKDGSTMAPLSLLMKGETLPAQTHWVGIPTQPIQDEKALTLFSRAAHKRHKLYRRQSR